MNFTDTVTVTARTATDFDALTGQPTFADVTVLNGVRCAFAVLGAAEAEQSFGTGATITETVTGSLTLPSWTAAALPDDYSTATVTVAGYAGTWRVQAVRPGREWTTYLLAKN